MSPARAPPSDALVHCPQLLCTSFLLSLLSWPAPGRAALAFREPQKPQVDWGWRRKLGSVCASARSAGWEIGTSGWFSSRGGGKTRSVRPGQKTLGSGGGLLPAPGVWGGRANRMLASTLI